ncbi:MAG: bifunctional molybdenum cofactor biosynthesis protein MoaC/MoaB [Propionibacteriaceae bacterium]|nr:bifunctional molybdenum cofactor biosynthesis protein MoaC/MoaB [Propionibacteriaceae bacterium]
MVDVADKAVTERRATARGRVDCAAAAAKRLAAGTLPKGDGLAVAKVAGLMAAKRTADLIPLCHPLGLDGAAVELTVGESGVEIEATIRSTGRTGVELEALTAVAVAGLTVIDMIKAVDRSARLTQVRVVAKSGGRSGSWVEPPGGSGLAPLSPPQRSDPAVGRPWAAGYVVVSDRCASGRTVDRTGPVLAAALERVGADSVVGTVVADEPTAIRGAVRAWLAAGLRLVVTSGGTGVGPRDVTPEALAPLFDKALPGVAELIRERGRRSTGLAVLGRSVAGVVGQAVLVALPGSPAAAADGVAALAEVLPHLLDQLAGGDHGHVPGGGPA